MGSLDKLNFLNFLFNLKFKKHFILVIMIIFLAPTVSYCFWERFFDDVIKFFEKKCDNIAEHYLIKKIKKLPKPKWKNTHLKGTFGDYLTAKRMTAMGYKKLKSKVSSIHGIDGVYIKKGFGNKIEEIVIIENKVDKALLNPGPPRQMSSEWIQSNIQKMLTSSDPQVKETGRLLDYFLKNHPNKLKRELWKHDTLSGKTIRYQVNEAGFIEKKIYEWDDKMISNTLNQWCNHGILECY